MSPRYLGRSPSFQQITDLSRIGPWHLTRKDVRLKSSHTTTLTYGRQHTPSYTFCRFMRLGLVLHCPQPSCWHVNFIDRFIRGIIISEQKAVPWHSHAVAFSISPKNSKSSNWTTKNVNTPSGDICKTGNEFAVTPIPIRNAHQSLVTTSYWVLCDSCHFTLWYSCHQPHKLIKKTSTFGTQTYSKKQTNKPRTQKDKICPTQVCNDLFAYIRMRTDILVHDAVHQHEMFLKGA